MLVALARGESDKKTCMSGERMSVTTFARALDQIQVLDVRPQAQFNAAHIPGKHTAQAVSIC